MKVRLEMKNKAINKISQAQADALSATGYQLKAEKIAQQEIPFDEGTLQNESTDVDDSNAFKGQVSIFHDMPYARRLYFHPEYDFQTDNNPNAKGRWWDDYLSGTNKDRARKIYKVMLKKYGGGYIK